MTKDFHADPHSTLTIKIEYAPDLEAYHDPAIPLITEGIILKNRYWTEQLPFLGIPERKWCVPVTPDEFTTKYLKVKPKEHGDAQLRAMSNEGLEILRNALGNLHRVATGILNERGGARIQRAEDGGHLPPGTGSGLFGPGKP